MKKNDGIRLPDRNRLSIQKQTTLCQPLPEPIAETGTCLDKETEDEPSKNIRLLKRKDVENRLF
jgi:hypothetical protein